MNRKITSILGLNIDIGNISSITESLILALQSRVPHSYVCVANVHMLTVARQNFKFAKILNDALFVVADGMPLVWIQRLKGFKNAERVSGPDLMFTLCELVSNHNLSIYLLGANSTTLTLLSQKLNLLFPKLKIAGMHAPDILPEQPCLDSDLINKINSSGANLLFVSLGCPKQEYWCATHAPHLNPIAIGVGAAFDFIAGLKKRPPMLIQQLGFEWFYRLISEPKRLWKRYLINNSLFIYYLLIDILKTNKKL